MLVIPRGYLKCIRWEFSSTGGPSTRNRWRQQKTNETNKSVYSGPTGQGQRLKLAKVASHPFFVVQKWQNPTIIIKIHKMCLGRLFKHFRFHQYRTYLIWTTIQAYTRT